MEKVWNVIPTVSVAGVEFGTDRKIIRKIFGKPINSFRKTLSSVNTTDVYPSFHVYYSADDKLNAIELFDENIKLNIHSRQVFPGTLDTAMNLLPDLEERYGSFVSKTSSIGISVEENNIDAILVGSKDYYK